MCTETEGTDMSNEATSGTDGTAEVATADSTVATPDGTAKPARLRKTRSTMSAIIGIIAVVGLLVSVLALWARSVLSDSDKMKLHNIAKSCGFTSERHLRMVFQQVVNSMPAEFRSRNITSSSE